MMMAYPILTDNTSGLLPVQRTIACKERRYDFCLTVYFLEWLPARCLLLQFMKAGKRLARSEEIRNIYSGGKVAYGSMGNEHMAQ